MKEQPIPSTSYVHPTAAVIGDVHIGEHVFVGPHATLRADEPGSSIRIGDHCNIQDGVIVHALRDSSVTIGPRTSLSHGCLVHGPCSIGSDCFVGFKSIVFRSRIEDGVFIKYSAIIEDVTIPRNKFVASSRSVNTRLKALFLRGKHADDRAFAENVINVNGIMLKKYLSGQF